LITDEFFLSGLFVAIGFRLLLTTVLFFKNEFAPPFLLVFELCECFIARAINGEAVALLDSVLFVLGSWHPLRNHVEVSWASDGFEQIVSANFLDVKIKTLQCTGHVVQKAWSGNDLLAGWSVRWNDLEAALDHLIEVGGEELWDSVVDTLLNFGG